jgi:hypoxanthine phosphoribosyltransferase
MLDMERAHLWAWDARPYPAFPSRMDVWADGPNYQRGHWLNGRATLQPLEAVAAEIAGRAGLDAIDGTAAPGLVRGYAVAEVGTARSALQPVLLSCGVDAVDRGGMFALRSRDGRVDAAADRGGLALRADMADLARELKFHAHLDFMAVSSYGASTQSSGVVKINKDLDTEVAGINVLLIEDIMDSGLTLSWLVNNMKARGAATVEVCAMFRKPEAVKIPVEVKYVGFDIPPAFVVGYGLDYAEKYRNVRGLGVLSPHIYEGKDPHA